MDHQWGHRVLDRPIQLLVKEILQKNPANNRLNRIMSYLVQWCIQGGAQVAAAPVPLEYN